jgi:hypothetical protein
VADRPASRTAVAFGVFFVAAGVAFLLEGLEVWNLELRMLAPALLIALGFAVLVGGRAGRS